MSRISIIIPTYNRAQLIGMTLDSIFAQTLPPYEVIVVDDGSSDGTKEILETHYGNRIIYLINKGKGPGAARNTGLSVATGNYIKFFDSDDWMSPNTLETQLKQTNQELKDIKTKFEELENQIQKPIKN